jgi:hypothetical protein
MNATMKRAVGRLTSDKKKFALMLTLLAFGMLLWGRLLLQGVPKTATAKPIAQSVVAETQAVVASDSKPAGAVVRLAIPAGVGRDLFSVDPSPYNRTAMTPMVQVVRKSDPQVSDDSIRSAVIMQSAGGLVLQSIVTGENPRVVINGVLLAPGQSIEGFTLVKVDDRTVWLENQGIVIRLRM